MFIFQNVTRMRISNVAIKELVQLESIIEVAHDHPTTTTNVPTNSVVSALLLPIK